MGLFEASLVFSITWWLVFLPILSMGTRSQHEAGEVTPGTEPGAPSETVKFGTKLLIATAGSALITALVWLIIRLHILDFIVQTPGSN